MVIRRHGEAPDPLYAHRDGELVPVRILQGQPGLRGYLVADLRTGQTFWADAIYNDWEVAQGEGILAPIRRLLDPLGIWEDAQRRALRSGGSPAEPAYDSVMTGRPFSWWEVAQITPISAREAERTANLQGLAPLSRFRWRYVRLPITVLDWDGWVSTLARYGAVPPADVRSQVLAGRFPPEDIATLMAHPEPPSELLAEALSTDVRNMQDIAVSIGQTGVYYPPILQPNMDTLDGAHRLAALYSLYGPGFQVYVWKPEIG